MSDEAVTEPAVAPEAAAIERAQSKKRAARKAAKKLTSNPQRGESTYHKLVVGEKSFEAKEPDPWEKYAASLVMENPQLLLNQLARAVNEARLPSNDPQTQQQHLDCIPFLCAALDRACDDAAEAIAAVPIDLSGDFKKLVALAKDF